MTLWQRLGLESEADLDDYATDHPARYQQAVSQMAAEEYAIKTDKRIAEQLAQQKQEFEIQRLTSTIQQQGIDPTEVQAFARYYGMPFNDKAYRLYLDTHRDKSNPVLAAQVEAQSKQINYIEQSHYRQRGKLSPNEVSKLSDEDLKAYMEWAKETALREG